MSTGINSWAKFEKRVRLRRGSLLSHLGDYPDAVLVAGCQRSGTTALTRVFKEALGMPPLGIARDDELEAALLLCGEAASDYAGRCCFQTTYLNERVNEYAKHRDFRLVWVIRRPDAVVRSMLFNWRRDALRRLFRGCGASALEGPAKVSYDRFGTFFLSRVDMACHSYNVKTAQVHYLSETLPPGRLAVVDYDTLLASRTRHLGRLFEFAGIEFSQELSSRLRKPRPDAQNGLAPALARRVMELCSESYENAMPLAEDWMA